MDRDRHHRHLPKQSSSFKRFRGDIPVRAMRAGPPSFAAPSIGLVVLAEEPGRDTTSTRRAEIGGFRRRRRRACAAGGDPRIWHDETSGVSANDPRRRSARTVASIPSASITILVTESVRISATVSSWHQRRPIHHRCYLRSDPASGRNSRQLPAIPLQLAWASGPGQSDPSVVDVRREYFWTRQRAPGTTAHRARARPAASIRSPRTGRP